MSEFYNNIKKVFLRLLFYINGFLNFRISRKFSKHLNGKNIIIYSMGKVGSSSIYYSFLKYFPFNKVFHPHFLSKYWHLKLKDSVYSRNINIGKETLKYLNQNNNNINHFIVLVRDPISRDLSNIIQNYKNKNIDLFGLDKNSLIETIRNEGHDFFNEWFETEFNEFFKIDISKFNFDYHKGYTIYEIDKKNRLMIIQLEKMNEVFISAIDSFLGFRFPELYNFNMSSKKLEGKIYKNLKKNYFLPISTLNKIYSAKFVSHFYSNEQIISFKERWSKKK